MVSNNINPVGSKDVVVINLIIEDERLKLVYGNGMDIVMDPLDRFLGIVICCNRFS